MLKVIFIVTTPPLTLVQREDNPALNLLGAVIQSQQGGGDVAFRDSLLAPSLALNTRQLIFVIHSSKLVIPRKHFREQRLLKTNVHWRTHILMYT